jgi:hypothetical protein
VRAYQVATAAAFVAIAAVAMFDSRRGALIGATGDPGGIGAGFYPFWSAALIAVAGLLLIWRTVLTPPSGEVAFAGRESVVALLKLVIPMIVATVSILWLGLYLATALYMGFFARYIGRYRWIWVAAIAVLMPLGIYLVFEQGFRMSLPKSILYVRGFPI